MRWCCTRGCLVEWKVFDILKKSIPKKTNGATGATGATVENKKDDHLFIQAVEKKSFFSNEELRVCGNVDAIVTLSNGTKVLVEVKTTMKPMSFSLLFRYFLQVRFFFS